MKLFVNKTHYERQPYNSVLYYNQPLHQNNHEVNIMCSQLCMLLLIRGASTSKHRPTNQILSCRARHYLATSFFTRLTVQQLLVHPSPRLPETHPVTLAAPRPASHKDHLISPDYFITDHTLLSFMIQSQTLGSSSNNTKHLLDKSLT